MMSSADKIEFIFMDKEACLRHLDIKKTRSLNACRWGDNTLVLVCQGKPKKG
jgi:hypothetical protein